MYNMHSHFGIKYQCKGKDTKFLTGFADQFCCVFSYNLNSVYQICYQLSTMCEEVPHIVRRIEKVLFL